MVGRQGHAAGAMVFWAALVGAACGDAATVADPPASAGGVGEPCYPNDTCDAELRCEQGRCEEGDGVPSCGDGRCDDEETFEACPEDCDAPPLPCGDDVCDASEDFESCPEDCPPPSLPRRVDVLVVLDDSGSMSEEQSLVAAALRTLPAALDDGSGAPDLHIGVVSTDMGVGDVVVPTCSTGGEGGALLVPASCDFLGSPYLIDAPPIGCTVTANAFGACTAHDCSTNHCTEGALVVDPDSGCPRCRNFDEAINDAAACLASLGTGGCGFERPLDAMRAALDAHPANAGFLRDDSVLAVLFVGDEDDCSAVEPHSFYDLNNVALGDPSFRCFHQSVTCDDNHAQIGPHEGCSALESPTALLTNVSEYVAFVSALRDPGRLVLHGIVGATNGGSVVVSELGGPRLDPTCTDATGSAFPGFRLEAFVNALEGGGVGSVCGALVPYDLSGFAARIRYALRR